MSRGSNSLIAKLPLFTRLCYVHKELKATQFYIIIYINYIIYNVLLPGTVYDGLSTSYHMATRALANLSPEGAKRPRAIN